MDLVIPALPWMFMALLPLHFDWWSRNWHKP